MSFFMGLATGLAKSVDTQLKESIERTRDNIDMVSKWRLKKAEEREKERRTKDKEVEALIQNAAYVISGDQNDVTAQNIAASLYKERGLTGFTEDIDFIKQQKAAGVGVRPLDFIQRANVDAPTNKYSLSEIVRSLSDAESSYAPSDMIFPKGTIRGSGLIGAIAPGFDVTAAGGQRATEQMQQIGLTTTPTAPSLSFAKYTFDREGLTYHTKDTNEKLSWLRDIIVNPASTPEQVKQAQDRENALLKLSVEQGDVANALAAAEQMLNRAKPTDENYESLTAQVTDLKDRIALQEAELEGEAAVLKVQAGIAARDGTDEGLAKALELNRKARNIEAGGIVTTETKLSDIEEDMKRKQAKFGDAYMNSTGEFAGRGYEEDNKMRMEYRTEIANFKGTTTNDINSMVTTIYSNAKKRLASMNPVMLGIINKAESAGSDTSKQFDVMMAEMLAARQRGEIDENSIEAFKSAIRDVAAKTKAMKAELGEETISVDRALDILLSESVSDTTGVQPPATGAAADTTAAGQTDAALAGQPQAGAAAGAGETGGTDTDVAGSVAGTDGTDADAVAEQVNTTKATLSEDIILDMRIDFPIDDPIKFLTQSESAGDNNNTIAANARVLYPDNPEFAATIDRLLSAESRGAATTALTDAGYTAGAILSPEQRSAAKQSIVTSLQVSDAEADYLLDRVFKRINLGERDIKNKQISDVRAALERRNVLGTFTGQVPEYRMDATVDFIAQRFSVSKEEARNLIDAATSPREDGIDAFDIETISPGGTMSMDEMRGDDTDADFATAFRRNTIIGQIFGDKDRSADVDYGALSTEELTALISDDASTNAQVVAASQELTKRSGLGTSEETSTSVSTEGPDLKTRREMGVDTTFTPDVIFRGMGSRIPYKKIGDDYYRIKEDGTLAKSPANTARKSILENPNRRDVERVGGVEDVSGEAPAKEKATPEANILTQDMNMSDVKAMSDVALIARYISGNMTDDMRNEFKRRLDTPSFVDQAAAIIDKVNAEKKSLASRRTKLTPEAIAAQKQRIQGQGALARGGLMRR